MPEPAPREHCAYCEAPLPAGDGVGGRGAAKYCCYGCRILGEGAARPIALSTVTSSPWFKIAVGAVLAGQAMLLGMAINLAPPSGLARWLLHGALIGASAGVLAILGGPLLTTAIEEIRRRRATVELLFLAGVAGALGASLHSTFTGTGAVYYEVVGVLTTVYAIGKTLGAQSRARALAETRQLHRTFETCQRVEPDGSARSVRVTEIRTGDQIRVLAGEPIPIDGRVVEGQAFVCETPLTGEPFPVVRRAGDTVWAGSYSEDGELRIAATAPGAKRRLDALLAALDSARERPCRIQAQADRMVQWFLPLVLVISLGTFGFWTWKSGWAAGLYNALAVLLVACPCAMGLATPVALWSGLAALASRGLVLRGGDEIERLATVREMVFDKTGTLSEEQYTFTDIETIGTIEERQRITGQLRAVQQACSHPVARAFHGFGKTEGDYTVRRVKTVPGQGIEAWIESARGEEHHLRAGGREMVSDRRGETELLSRLRHSRSDHLVYVEVEGQLAAIAAVNERLRGSARETLRTLEQLGLNCLVMTGDNPERAARLLGRRSIEGGLSPNEKAARIEELNQMGREVCFVGDGVNDAPAMRAASIGIALAHGAGVTTAGADAVLYGGDLRVLAWAVALSRQVRDSIRSNLLFAGAYNLVGIVLAATGLLHPVVSALLMVVSSFTVSWRAMRATECGYACGAGAAAAATEETSPALPGADLPAEAVGSRGRGWLDLFAPRISPGSTGSRFRRARLISSLLLAAQIPFVIYLGQLSGLGAILTAMALLLIAVVMFRFHPDHPDGRHLADMTSAMLGFGNWGMILGWWADGGFNPVHACCLGTLGGGFSFLGFTAMPWMNGGMLLFGLPPMLIGPERTYRGLGRAAYGILSSIGMVWGMSFGSHVFMNWLGLWTSDKFLLSLSGMTVGMLLGMVLGCEFGRAVSLALRAGRQRAEPGP